MKFILFASLTTLLLAQQDQPTNEPLKHSYLSNIPAIQKAAYHFSIPSHD